MNRAHALRRMVTGASLAVGVLGGAVPSYAYRMIQNTTIGRVTSGIPVTCGDRGGFARWNTSFIQWFHNPAGQGAGKGQALRNAMASWNRAANGSHSLTWGGETTAAYVTDGQNSIVWAVGNGCGNKCLALTALVLQQGQVIVESDITFNANETWRTNGTDFDTEAVAAHEIGHSLGIHHTDVTGLQTPTMNAEYFGPAGRSLESDDRDAIGCSQQRYPPGPPTPEFLTVTSAMCNGLNDVLWGASTGATTYQLFGSTTFNFSSTWLEYSGPGTGHPAIVSQTTFLRVRACHATGCSVYRVGNQPARVYNGCI